LIVELEVGDTELPHCSWVMGAHGGGWVEWIKVQGVVASSQEKSSRLDPLVPIQGSTSLKETV